jgi:lysophospholipase L1-like esterase
MVLRRAVATVALALAAIFVVAKLQAPPFEDEILKFEAADKVKMPAEGSVLFVGSSSIRLWTTLAKDFPEYPTLNRGFGGSQVADSVRLVDRIVTPYKPKVIVFFAGTNDLASGKSPETVLADYKAFVDKVRLKLPTVPIGYISCTPAPSRWNNIKNVRKLNELIKSYCEATPNLKYIDTYPLLVNNIGGPRAELFIADNLHMNAKGYAIWTPVVREYLKEVFPK